MDGFTDGLQDKPGKLLLWNTHLILVRFFQLVMMPFELQGAPATFQRTMGWLLTGACKFAAAYLDNLVIYSSTWSDHLQHICFMLQRLQEAGLTVKLRKCQFGMQQCTYLGFVV